MNIDMVMLGTRRYFVMSWSPDAFTVGTNRTDISAPSLDCTFKTRAAAQIACDRLNLLAVLEAILEPNTVMLCAGVDADDGQTGIERIKHIHRAMIGALIAEVKNR